MKLLALINPENVAIEVGERFRVREAARAVVIDENKNIALLHVTKENYYKLPGGGIEENEDRIVALQRECREEIGSEVEVIKEIGSIIEYRKIFKLKQISFSYLAKLNGEKVNPQYTKKELKQGFKQVWLPYSEALEKLSQNFATSFEGKNYIVPRDLIILQTVEEFFSQ